MVTKRTAEAIDLAIKAVWNNNIKKDYLNSYLLKEDSLKCCFYYHLRRKLATILEENNLRIFSEYYFPQLGCFADLAIVQTPPAGPAEYYLARLPYAEVVTVIEFKYDGGNSVRAENWNKK